MTNHTELSVRDLTDQLQAEAEKWHPTLSTQHQLLTLAAELIENLCREGGIVMEDAELYINPITRTLGVRMP